MAQPVSLNLRQPVRVNGSEPAADKPARPASSSDRYISPSAAASAAKPAANLSAHLKKLRHLAHELGYTPSGSDIGTHLGQQVLSELINAYGSAVNAGRAARLGRNADKTPDRMLIDLVQLARKIGRDPTEDDVDKDLSLASSLTYDDIFAGYDTALVEAGIVRVPKERSPRKKDNQAIQAEKQPEIIPQTKVDIFIESLKIAVKNLSDAIDLLTRTLHVEVPTREDLSYKINSWDTLKEILASPDTLLPFFGALWLRSRQMRGEIDVDASDRKTAYLPKRLVLIAYKIETLKSGRTPVAALALLTEEEAKGESWAKTYARVYLAYDEIGKTYFVDHVEGKGAKELGEPIVTGRTDIPRTERALLASIWKSRNYWEIRDTSLTWQEMKDYLQFFGLSDLISIRRRAKPYSPFFSDDLTFVGQKETSSNNSSTTAINLLDPEELRSFKDPKGEYFQIKSFKNFNGDHIPYKLDGRNAFELGLLLLKRAGLAIDDPVEMALLRSIWDVKTGTPTHPPWLYFLDYLKKFGISRLYNILKTTSPTLITDPEALVLLVSLHKHGNEETISGFNLLPIKAADIGKIFIKGPYAHIYFRKTETGYEVAGIKRLKPAELAGALLGVNTDNPVEAALAVGALGSQLRTNGEGSNVTMSEFFSYFAEHGAGAIAKFAKFRGVLDSSIEKDLDSVVLIAHMDEQNGRVYSIRLLTEAEFAAKSKAIRHCAHLHFTKDESGSYLLKYYAGTHPEALAQLFEKEVSITEIVGSNQPRLLRSRTNKRKHDDTESARRDHKVIPLPILIPTLSPVVAPARAMAN